MPVIMTTDGRVHGSTPDKAEALKRVPTLTKPNGPAVKLITDEEWMGKLYNVQGFEARAEILKGFGEVIGS